MDELEFDPLTREYVFPGGQRVTQEVMQQRAVTPGQSGNPNLASVIQSHNVPDRIHVWDVLGHSTLVDGKVLRFIIEKRTTQQNRTHVKQLHYAALHAGGKWYLTGAGEWYGTNVLTKEQMLEVLQRDECVSVQVAERWENLDHRPPF